MKVLNRKLILFTVMFLLDCMTLSLAQEQQSSVEVRKGACEGMNLIMISINNIGTQHMSLYGYQRKTTPYLDQWAKDAFVFENMFTPASWTLPAATSVFTSLFPYTHGVLDRTRGNLLNVDIRTFPQLMQENGYETAAFTGGLDQSSVFGHMNGFKTIPDNSAFTSFNVTLKQAKRWLGKNAQKKFFLFIQGYDAHPPFTPKRKFKDAFIDTKIKNIKVNRELVYRGFKKEGDQYAAFVLVLRSGNKGLHVKNVAVSQVILKQDDIDYLMDSYDAEVLSVDDMVGGFLESLDKSILDNTMIIVMSEHGEMFAKHGRFGRAGTMRGTLYDDVIHVPFILKIPVYAGGRIDGLSCLVDIMPTVADLLGLKNHKTMQGKSLLPLFNHKGPVNDYVYAGAFYNVPVLGRGFRDSPGSANEAIRNKEWKLIREVSIQKEAALYEEMYELYNIAHDPSELHNVVDQYSYVAEELKEKLMLWVQDTKSFNIPPVQTHRPPDRLIEDARKHGYW